MRGGDRGHPSLALVLALVVSPGLFPGSAAAQEPVRSPTAMGRIVEARAESETPHFGEVFDLHVTLRVSRSRPVIVLDTLGPTYALRSAEPASWELAEAPGDSVDLVATYPVISFRSGFEPLPGLLLIDGRDFPADAAAIRVIGGPTDLQGLDATGIPAATGGPSVVARAFLGDTEIVPIEGFSDGGEAAPRPAADVLGGSWSPWAFLAIGSLLAAALGLTGMTVGIVRRRWPDRVGSAPSTGPISRDEALRRLDEIRAAGWRSPEELEEFYRASTDTLRRFVEGRDSRWSAALTSHELLVEARRRWGAERLESVAPAVGIAERVKFGGLRPDVPHAERDWQAIRGWVAGAPDKVEEKGAEAAGASP